MRKTKIKIIAVVFVLSLIAALFTGIWVTTNAVVKESAGFPFLLGAARNPANEVVPLMSYTFGKNPGTVPTDGTVINYPISDTFAQFETHPDSDHPDGIAYIWVYDDAENLYFVLDWTSDDTYDYGDDYFTVYINDGADVKVYTQHTEPVGGAYGVAVFGDTSTADYPHMWYAIAVPKTDLNDEMLKVGFELYGTAAIFYNTT